MCVVGSCLCGRTFSNPEKKKGEEKHKVKYFIHLLGPSLGHKQNCLVTLLSGHPGEAQARHLAGREPAMWVGSLHPPAWAPCSGWPGAGSAAGSHPPPTPPLPLPLSHDSVGPSC